MNNLREIRGRLKSVENVKKITEAMERMSAARLRRAQMQAEQSRPYFNELKSIVTKIASTGINHPLFKPREIKKTGVIVIAADKGLSGSYNTTILDAADKFLSTYSPDQVELLLFGRKAIQHYKNTKWPITFQKMHWGGKLKPEQLQEIINDIVNRFLSSQLDDIWIVFTRYISLMRREAVIDHFLPIGKNELLTSNESHEHYIFEPSTEEILAKILPKYTRFKLKNALSEAYASELAARIVAMQMASKNSNNMINDLTLLRNKMRQEGITREIIEVSSTARI